MSEGPLVRPAFRREVQLDFIRGLAVLMVVDFHTSGLLRRAGLPLQSGDLGVSIFFVLSGFLVGGILLREWSRNGVIDAGRFLIRRGLKIWPQYYVFLLTMVLTRHRSLKQLTGNFLNLQNYMGGVAHTWSLAVEEHGYLLLTLFFVLVARVKYSTAAILKSLVVLNVVAALYRDTMLARGTNVFSGTEYRLDGIGWGVVLAMLFLFYPEGYSRVQHFYPLWMVGLLLPFLLKTAVGVWPPFAVAVYDVNNLFGIAVFLLLYRRGGAGLHNQATTWLYRAVAWIGLYSYGIYLWHVSVIDPVTRLTLRLHLQKGSLVTGMLEAIAGIALGTATTEVIELSMLRARDRLVPRRVSSMLEVGIEEVARS